MEMSGMKVIAPFTFAHKAFIRCLFSSREREKEGGNELGKRFQEKAQLSFWGRIIPDLKTTAC